MARTKLNEDSARRAFLSHYARTGEALTYDALRVAAGGGSHRDIQKLMETFVVEASDLARAEAVLPDDVMDEIKAVLSRTYRVLKNSTEEALEALSRTSAAAIEAANGRARCLADQLDLSQAENSGLKAMVANLEQRLVTCGAERDEQRQLATAAEAQLKVFRELVKNGTFSPQRDEKKRASTIKAASSASPKPTAVKSKAAEPMAGAPSLNGRKRGAS